MVALPRAADAAEGGYRLGAEAGVGVLSGRGTGPAVGVFAGYGLLDFLDVVLAGHGSWHDGTDVQSLSAGLAYELDVIRWIPHAALLGGYYRYGGDPGPHGEHGSRAGASVEVGVDYLLMRELSLGADVRWHASFDEKLSFPLFTGMLGAAYRWGY